MGHKGTVGATGLLIALLLGTSLAASPELVVYSGRSKSLVQPVIDAFSQKTGVRVRVKYGKTAALALLLLEEGRRSPADLFWGQDAGALGLLARNGRFEALPENLLAQVPARFRSAQGFWVGVTGRARTLAYSTQRLREDELPASVFDLTEPRWKGRVGWAPGNASFQSFVTAMRAQHGDEATLGWLEAMKANGAVAYPKNTAILQGIAAGEVDVGLPNHYYLLRFKRADPDYPVAQTFFAPGDAGNLVNVAGVGVVRGSRHRREALELIAYLLDPATQAYFTQEVFEYPLVDGVEAAAGLPAGLQELRRLAPPVDLDRLYDLEGTLELLRRAGLL